MNTKEKLMQLLELCIEKGLNCTIDNDCKVVNIMLLNHKNEKWKFYEYTHFGSEVYEDDLKNNEHNQRNLNDLITKVKNYQP